jgi:4-amino-4-deoxy-L-arabinose transferase-like glycosyltransferase
MVPLMRMSDSAVYLLVPCFGALLVWCTYRLGRVLGDGFAGALAAVLLSISPTFLYQVVQPMSDVPAAACWVAALLIASRATDRNAASAALIASLAVLIRPNLAPLGAIVFVVGVFSGSGRTTRPETVARARRAAAFVLAIVPGIVVLGWIQHARYGSATASGYGTLSDAFAFAYIRENLARYPRWLTETHTWFIWLSAGAPLWIVRRSHRRLMAWAVFALALAVWASYLPYLPFHEEEWFYTRFLLPSIAIMLFFASAITLWGLRKLPLVARAAAVVALFGALVVHGLYAARARGAFDIRIQERKYPLAGAFVRDHLPSNAIVLAAQHSGSIRFYSGRPTFRWDLLSPTRLDQALATFRVQGYEPFLVVDGGEYEAFKSRFDATRQRGSAHPTLLSILGDARVYALP